jgi:glycerophosphoryl diester phosphodiesterase
MIMNRLRLITTAILAGIMLFPASVDARKKTGIVAHRGFWNCEEAGYAKNSVAALRCAQEAGFWGSEFDVNMTSDGVLIVYHDSNIGDKQIEKYPYSEFKDHKIKNGETIPTIDQYLEQGKKYPKTMLVYEMKPHSCAEVEDRFIELTIAKLKEYNLLNPRKVMFISFSLHICKEMAKRLPGFTVQYLEGNMSPAEVDADGINGIDYHYNVFNNNNGWVKEAQKLDMSVNAWTVNKVENMEQMLNLHVNYLTTDYPLDARALIKEMKGIREIR